MEEKSTEKETSAQAKARKKRAAVLQRELREKTTGYIVTSLGLVAGLAWNDAISNFIKYLFPLDSKTLIAKFIYAGIISIVVILMSQGLLRVLSPKEDEE